MITLKYTQNGKRETMNFDCIQAAKLWNAIFSDDKTLSVILQTGKRRIFIQN
jgi:hypothetical protein